MATVNDTDTLSEPNTVNQHSDLPILSIGGNWSLPPSRQPQLIVHEMGHQIDSIKDELISRLNSENKLSMAVGLASDISVQPGVSWPIRIVHQFQPGHTSATDVVLRSEGDDLYVSFQSRANTWLAYFNFLLRGLAILLSVLFFLWAYLGWTGARRSWIKDYADKHTPLIYGPNGNSTFLADRLMNGGYTFHWNAFNREVITNPETRNIVFDTIDQAEDYLKNEATQGESGFEQFRYIMGSEAMTRGMRASRENVFQWFASDFKYSPHWLYNDYHNNYFIWLSSESLVFHHPPIFGMEIGSEDTGDKVWSSIEVPQITPLRNRFVEFENNRGILIRTFDKHVEYHQPWSLAKLSMADPRAALFNLGMPATVLFGIFGFLVWRAPRSWLRIPCRILNWLTPDEFDNQAIGRNAWVERVFSKTLADFGVSRAQVTELNVRGNHGAT